MTRHGRIFTAGGIGVPVLVVLIMMAGDAVARPGGPAAPAGGRMIAGLDEPFVATGPTSPEDDRALDLAIAAFRIAAARSPADVPSHLAPLARFVATHPGSGWNAAVLTNLGLVYYRAGYFSQALDSWQTAWRDGRDATDVRAKAVIDRTLSELVRLHARLGRVDDLESLFKQVGDRPLGEAAAEVMTGARARAWSMRHDPGAAYLCGPNALKDLLIARGAGSDAIAALGAALGAVLRKERSGPHGISLWHLAGLADRAGLHYRLIRRGPGQAVPVPSIVHWNVQHFATIVGTRAGGYLVQDSTPGLGREELWIREAAIDTETSGFFLVPGDAAQDPRWHEVTVAEASRLYGMGSAGARARASVGHSASARASAADQGGPFSFRSVSRARTSFMKRFPGSGLELRYLGSRSWK